MDREKLMKIAGAVRTGGKGTVRRKKKAVHKTTSTDDKRLQNTLKRLGVNTIPGIEEVMIFKDQEVIHFTNPKEFTDMLPSILPHMSSPEDLGKLKQMMATSGVRQTGDFGRFATEEEDDDDVPDLVENFDEGN